MTPVVSVSTFIALFHSR